MTYQVPAAETGGEFEFKHGRKAYKVPLIEDLPLDRIDAMNALRGMSMSELSIRELTHTLFGNEVGPVVYTMTPKQFAGLVEAWEKASSTTVGESEPSES